MRYHTGRSSAGLSYSGWSFGPGTGCLLAIGWFLAGAALAGMAIAIVAWPWLVTPGWPRWVAEAAWLALLAAGLLAPHRARHRGPAPPSGPGDGQPTDPGGWQHLPRRF
jgi:hypothetical protein